MRLLLPITLCALAATLRATPVDPVNFSETLFLQSSNIGVATQMAWAPDGTNRLFVLTKTGKVRIIQNGALLSQNFATESPQTSGECGLLSITFDPDFLNNHFIYCFLSVSGTEQQIIRYTAAGNVATNRTVIISGLPTRGANHNAGATGIGPDGRLYWAVGDNGNGTGVNGDLTLAAAKISRANRFSGAPCADNPFFDGPGPNNDYIWARGFRNPFTFVFEPARARMWINVVGTRREQIFIVNRGDHAGWNDYEGDQPAGFLAPVIAYGTRASIVSNIAAASRTGGVATFTTSTAHELHRGGKVTVAGVGAVSFNGTFFIAGTPTTTSFTVAQALPDEASSGGTVSSANIGGCVTGGCFYDSTAFPSAYHGDYFFGDYVTDVIQHVRLDANGDITSVDDFVTASGNHVDAAVGPDGALYYIGNTTPGKVYRLATTSTAQNVIVQPTNVNVVGGGSALFTVRLAQVPAANVVVNISKLSGYAGVNIATGSTLTFTPANWNQLQTVTLSAAADAGLVSDSATFHVSAPGIAEYDVKTRAVGQGLAVWRGEKFSPAEQGDTAISGDLADIDGDGFANLVEYVLDTSPKSPAPARAPQPRVVNVAGTDYLALEFTRASWANDVTVTVEAAADPAGPWTPIDPALQFSALADTPGLGLTTITVRDTQPLSAGPRFMRLRVARP